jgi:hypothetical protein
MSKHLKKEYLYNLPSGNLVHPCRLIVRDGTLMWKHAFLCNNKFTGLPETQAQEQHIIKTAQRLEELNVWVSQDLELWECLTPHAWYDPDNSVLSDGISVFFSHRVHPTDVVYDKLKDHIQPHETLKVVDMFPHPPLLFFKRC